MTPRISQAFERFNSIIQNSKHDPNVSNALNFMLGFFDKHSSKSGYDITFSTASYSPVFAFLKAYDQNSLTNLDYLSRLLIRCLKYARYSKIPRSSKIVEVGHDGMPFLPNRRLTQSFPKSNALKLSKLWNDKEKLKFSSYRFSIKPRKSGYCIFRYLPDLKGNPTQTNTVVGISDSGDFILSSRGSTAYLTKSEASNIVRTWNNYSRLNDLPYRYTVFSSPCWPKHLRKIVRSELNFSSSSSFDDSFMNGVD